MVPGAQTGVIGILDIDMGNLRSVSKAVYELGFDFTLVVRPAQLKDVTHLMIPGVGAYSTAMDHVDALELRAPIRDFAAVGKPVLGICLGMQVLSTFGEEGGASHGLDLIPGSVSRLQPRGDLVLPHVGWNTTRFAVEHPVFRKVKNGLDFYFVHSYHFKCADPAHLLATSDYGQDFAAIVGKANVLGFQFHPEKSQSNGLKLIENFCSWDGTC